MNTHSIAMMVTAAVLSLAVSGARSEESATGSTDPLAPFERLVGGRWSIEGSYQEFEWGLGRRSVKARGYFVIDGEPMLVSEGMWSAESLPPSRCRSCTSTMRPGSRAT